MMLSCTSAMLNGTIQTVTDHICFTNFVFTKTQLMQKNKANLYVTGISPIFTESLFPRRTTHFKFQKKKHHPHRHRQGQLGSPLPCLQDLHILLLHLHHPSAHKTRRSRKFSGIIRGRLRDTDGYLEDHPS